MVGKVKDLKRIHFNPKVTKNASMKVLVGASEGWQDHVLRVVELKEFGYSPKHAHPWPHINYVLEGVGEIEIDGKIDQIKKGSYMFVPGNTLHQFRNTSNKTLKFICIVPTQGHIY
jgi:quercetin dioxygenase-like cupin family protein